MGSGNGTSTDVGNGSSYTFVKEELKWPEPIQRVQGIAQSGIKTLPNVYIKPEPEYKYCNWRQF